MATKPRLKGNVLTDCFRRKSRPRHRLDRSAAEGPKRKVLGQQGSSSGSVNVVALVPAHNEANSIAATLDGLMGQTRRPDLTVVIPNGCSDETANLAREYPVVVLELPALRHRKSEALNRAWNLYAREADIVVCLDADTVLPPNAVKDWCAEFETPQLPPLGGSSSKFTMQAPGLLSRLQKAEFATWTDSSLRRGSTSVLAGTGCSVSNAVLRTIAARPDREGPWTYTSAVEDFELSYRIRELGFICQVSPTVRAYTDSMKTIRALWGQRMKWQVGTVEDLIRIGMNRLTLRDWGQQAMGLLGVLTKLLWIGVLVSAWSLNMFHLILFWWIVPLLFVALDIKRALRIPHRDARDLLIAATFFPQEAFMWLRSGWFLASWWSVFVTALTHRQVDRWANQYKAEEVI